MGSTPGSVDPADKRVRAELVVLGSAGWLPQNARMTTCLAVTLPGTLLLFDAGTGLARLIEPRFRGLIPADGLVHLFLSHLHLDHTVGLTFLPAVFWNVPVILHVPGRALSGLPAEEAIDRLVGPPFFPLRLDEFPAAVAVQEMEVCPGGHGSVVVAGLGGEVGGLAVRARVQRHAGGSLGFRLGDALAFLTDTVFDPESVAFASGARVLVHEAWIRGDGDSEQMKRGLTSHTSAEDAARIARDAGAEELLLSHLSPLVDEEYYLGMVEAARRIFPPTSLCEDGLRRTL